MHQVILFCKLKHNGDVQEPAQTTCGLKACIADLNQTKIQYIKNGIWGAKKLNVLILRPPCFEVLAKMQ